MLERRGSGYIEPDGREHTAGQVLEHVRHQARAGGAALVEEHVEPHPELAAFSPHGTMPDFRLYFTNVKLLFTMMRVPTKASRGYGNQAMGALPLVAGPDGVIRPSPLFRATMNTVHPDTGRDFNGVRVPHWEELVTQAGKVPPLFRSRPVCVDGSLDTKSRFVVLEVTLVPSFVTFSGWDWLFERLEF